MSKFFPGRTHCLSPPSGVSRTGDAPPPAPHVAVCSPFLPGDQRPGNDFPGEMQPQTAGSDKQRLIAGRKRRCSERPAWPQGASTEAGGGDTRLLQERGSSFREFPPVREGQRGRAVEDHGGLPPPGSRGLSWGRGLLRQPDAPAGINKANSPGPQLPNVESVTQSKAD